MSIINNKIIKRIMLLKKEIEFAKKDKLFDFFKFINNEYSTLNVNGIRIKRIKEFSNLDTSKLPEEIKKDEELMCFIWHYMNLEDEYEFKNGKKKLETSLKMKEVAYPYTDKSQEDEVVEDEVEMKNLISFIRERESKLTVDGSGINFLDSKKYTKRQIQVIKLYLKGLSNSEIMKKLKIDRPALSRIFDRYLERSKK